MKRYQTRNIILFHIILLILFKIENKNMNELIQVVNRLNIWQTIIKVILKFI